MPNHTLSNPTRPELSEAKYRAYEDNFIEFLAVYPAPYRCRPVRGALTSLVIRLREAANAVLHNSEKFRAPLLLNLENFRACWAKVTVSIRDDEVVIAEPAALSDIARAKASEGVVPKAILTISDPTLADLIALSLIFQRRGCTDPILFLGDVPPFSPPIGVAFESTAEGWMML